MPPPDMQRIREFTVERLDFHKQLHFGLLPGYMSSTEVFFHVDAMMGDYCAWLKSSAIKGEMTDESRQVEQVHTVQVFATWKDHLLYVVKRDWTWLPGWVLRRLAVRYVPLAEKFSITVPVKVTKVCPHANIQWGRDMVKHMLWIEPNRGWE